MRQRGNWRAAGIAAWIVAVAVLAVGIRLSQTVNSQVGWQVSVWWTISALAIWVGSWALITELLTRIRRRVQPSKFDAIATGVSLLALWLLLGNWAATIPRSQGLELVAGTGARWLAALVVATALALIARQLRMGLILLTTAVVVSLVAPVQAAMADLDAQSRANDNQVQMTLSEDPDRPSVLWIVVDESQYSLFFEDSGRVRDLYPNLQRLQQDSTTYTHAVSVASETLQAIPTMLAASADTSALGFDRVEDLATRPPVLEALDAHYNVAWMSKYLPSPCDTITCEPKKSTWIPESLKTAWELSWNGLAGSLIGQPIREWLPAPTTTTEAGGDLWDVGKYDRGADIVAQMNLARSVQPSDPLFTFWHHLGTHLNWNLDFHGNQIFDSRELDSQLGGGLVRDSRNALLSAQHGTLERRMYAATAAEFDRELGVVLGALRESGEYDNTMVAFTADHGTTIDVADTERRTPQDPALMWSQVARVPLLVKEPHQNTAALVTAPRSNGQVMSTVLQAAGATLTAPWPVAPPLDEDPDKPLVFAVVRGEELRGQALNDADWLSSRQNQGWQPEDFGQLTPSPFTIGLTASELGGPVPNGWLEFGPRTVRTADGASTLIATRVAGFHGACTPREGLILVADGDAVVGSLSIERREPGAKEVWATGIVPRKSNAQRTFWCRTA